MPVNRATVARTEGSDRGVTLDEALLYAAALGVSPDSLIFPLKSSEAVSLAPELSRRAREIRAWFRGRGPLREEDRRAYYSEVSDEDWARMTETRLNVLLNGVQDLLDAIDDQDQDRAVQLLEDVNDEIERTRRAVRGMKGGNDQ